VTVVHVVVPDGIDDPTRPSGGNVYDRRVCRELASLGWSAPEHAVPGFWEEPNAGSFAALEGVIGQLADDAVVLLDGLIASSAPSVLVPHARRLRLVVLVHMPLGHRPAHGEADPVRAAEREVLSAATAVVTTSAWARRRLVELYGLAPARVHVAPPGVDAGELASGTATGAALLCVATVTFDKGHDVLLDALAMISDLSWSCECVGRLDREPAFVAALRRRVREDGLADRVRLSGPRDRVELDRTYAAADVMVLASRSETYGMVVTEALAHGLPVIAADVGGLTEALGPGADGFQPGLLVAPEDPTALAEALRAWLGDPERRRQLRRAARERRTSLPGWPATASAIARVLAGAAR
jgi:glycosyltransferase involved in cell wall biosynthesis